MAGVKGMSMPDWTCPCGRVVHGNLAYYSHLLRHARENAVTVEPYGGLDELERLVKNIKTTLSV